MIERVDEGALAGALTAIVRERLADDDATVVEVNRTERGFSTETYLFTVKDGSGASTDLVLRRPPAVSLFPDYDLRRQYVVMERLARATDLPVPTGKWIDPSGDNPLGTPYLVMNRIAEGSAPSDFPSYHTAGNYFEADESGRRAMWFGCIDAMARVHKVDVDAARLGFLAMPQYGTRPLEQIVNYVDMAVHWAADRISPTYDRALAWLRQNEYEPEHTTLLWGDARMSNILYAQDHSITGVLDWEIAYLGDHEADLAWMLFLDWASSEFEGHPALPGTPTRAESIARYEEQTGWKVRNLDYNEVLAAVLLAIPIIRMSAFLNLGPDVDIMGFCTARIEQIIS